LNIPACRLHVITAGEMEGPPDESAAACRPSVAAAAANMSAKTIPHRGHVEGIPGLRRRRTSSGKAVPPPGGTRPLGAAAFPAVPAREEEDVLGTAADALRDSNEVPHSCTDPGAG
jgi:hypothetical protein